MTLAFCFREDEPEAAKSHLDKAKKIVRGDKRLIIRKRQIEDLAKIVEN